MATGTIQKSTDYDILYDTLFQTGSVTLKQSIANYKYIEVVFGSNVFRMKNNYSSSSTQVAGCWGVDYTDSSNKGMIWSAIQFSISGKTFTISNHSRMYYYPNSTKPTIDSSVYGYVSEIRGYH